MATLLKKWYNQSSDYPFRENFPLLFLVTRNQVRIFASVLSAKRQNELNFKNNSKEKKVIRTGLGYDKHRLIENRKLLIGGIEIPFTKGEDGHSDGDAVLHAITDALLGASHLGDIGSYFPDTDEKYKNADSKELLKFAWNDVLKNGWQLENLDIVLLLQEPKFLPYRENVINSISTILGVENERIFINIVIYNGYHI